MRNCDLEERNWRDVAKALRQIEHYQLAKEIENVDKTGHDNNYIITVTIVIINDNNVSKHRNRST